MWGPLQMPGGQCREIGPRALVHAFLKADYEACAHLLDQEAHCQDGSLLGPSGVAISGWILA